MAVDLLDTDKAIEAKTYVRRFLLWPARWQTFDVDLSKYKWKEFQFNDFEMLNIPHNKGVYTFVIKPNVAAHPACSYIMYVGQTTEQTLQTRFGQYLDEQKGKRKSRPKVKFMLSQYKDNLFFVCLPTDSKISPVDLENKLLGALIPPINDEDALPAEVRQIVKAALS